MAKKKIKNAQQLISALMEFAELEIGDDKLDKAQFEEMAEARYEGNRELRHTRINDFANASLMGQGDNTVGKYNQAKRVNDKSMDTDNIAYAAFYAGVSAVGARRFGKTINIVLAPQYISFLGEFRKKTDYAIAPEAIAELRNLNNQASKIMMYAHSDFEHLPLEQLPQITQDNVVSNCLSAFFDKSLYGRNDNFNLTPAMKDFFNEAMAEGKKFMEAAYGDKGFTPETPEQKAALNHLKQLAKDNKKQAAFNDYQVLFENQLEAKVTDIVKNPEKYAASNEPTLKFDSVSLLEGMTAESFIDNKHNRSYTETEYGETVVDNLMKQIYLDDQVKDMNKHGIDPCTHIYVDGVNALDLPSGEIRTIDGVEQVLSYRDYFAEKGENPTLLDYAKLKCDICAAALSGSKIDIVEHYKKDGEYVPMTRTTPIMVDAKDMDKEPVPLWKRILMFFGIIKDPEKEITKSNQLESHEDTANKIEESIRERMSFNDLTADEAKPRTTEAVENDKQLEHTNEL